MKIINKTMDSNDLKTNDAKKVINELIELDKHFTENNCIISSWVGRCNPTKYEIKVSIANKGYNYKPIVDNYDFDMKYPNFLLWETYWIFKNLKPKKGDTLLDIGGACSLFSFYMASKGIKVVAIDINKEIVDNANLYAKKMGLDYTAICADGDEYLKNTCDKYDFITSICVIEHIEINKRKNMIRNIYKHLNKNGKVGFTFDYKNPEKFVGINNPQNIKEHFLDNTNLEMLENKNFYDNNINYLVSKFYYKPIIWHHKISDIRRHNFPITELFKTKKENDYTFGAIFLKRKK